MTNPDPVIIADGRAWEVAQCERLLRPYAKVDGATGALLPLDNWATLTGEGCVLVGLLAARLAYLCGVVPYDRVEPNVIEAMIKRPGGSVRPALKRLVAAQVVSRGRDGRYCITANQAARIRARWLPLAAAQTETETESEGDGRS